MDHDSSSLDPPIEALDRLSVVMEKGPVSQLAKSSPKSDENEPTASTDKRLPPIQLLPPELMKLIAREVAATWDDDFHARSGGSASSLSKRMQETINYGLVCRSGLAPFRHEMWRSVNLSFTPPISPFWLRLAEAHKRAGALSCNITRLAITENKRVIALELAAEEVLIANQLSAALSNVHELHLVGHSAPELWLARSPRPLRFPDLVNLSLYLHSPFQKPAEYIYFLADIPTLRRLTLRVLEMPGLLPAARETEQARLQYAPASGFQRIPLEVFSFQWTLLDLYGGFTVTRAIDDVFTLDEVKSIKLGPARFDQPTLTRLASLVNLESLTIASWPDVLREYTTAIDTTLVDLGNLRQLRLVRQASPLMHSPDMSLSPTETIRLLHALPATLQALELEVDFPASAEPDLRTFLDDRRGLPLVHFDVSLRLGRQTELFPWDKDGESGWVRRGTGGDRRTSRMEQMRAAARQW